MATQEKDHIFELEMKKDHPVFVKAEGIYLYDSKGKRYIDGIGGAIVVNIGQGVKEIIDVMTKQAQQMSYVLAFHYKSEPQKELAEKIAEWAPEGLSKVFFVSGGSEANESALKLARSYHIETGNPSKYKVISRWQSYHGNTIGALSMSGRVHWRHPYTPYLLDFPHISPPICYRCRYELEYPQCDVICAHELERVIKVEGPQNVSAFIVEAIIGGSSGAAIPPPEYFPIVRSICDKYNVLLIVDEVITGFGRTGKNFGIQHFGITPDIITTGKGMSSGYTPIGAAIAHERIYEGIKNGSGVFFHGFTYGGNPLSCAVSLAVLRYIEEHNLVAQAAEMGDYFLGRSKRLNNLPMVGDIRGKGMLMGIEFVSDKEKKTPFDRRENVAELVAEIAFEKGLIIIPAIGNVDGILGDFLLLGPPYVMNPSQMDEMIDILEEAIQEAYQNLGKERKRVGGILTGVYQD